jgi:hypothetical protein
MHEQHRLYDNNAWTGIDTIAMEGCLHRHAMEQNRPLSYDTRTTSNEERDGRQILFLFELCYGASSHLIIHLRQLAMDEANNSPRQEIRADDSAKQRDDTMVNHDGEPCYLIYKQKYQYPYLIMGLTYCSTVTLED